MITPQYSTFPRSSTIDLTDDDPTDEAVAASTKKPLHTNKKPLVETVVLIPKPIPSDRFFRRDGTYISLSDKEEIHHEKVVAAWWSAVPFLGDLFAFCSWIGEYINKPESNAYHRVDYQLDKRSYESAIDQEIRLKDARNKARFTTVFSSTGLACLLLSAGVPLPGRLVLASLLAITIPIAYQTGEHPELNTFNQGL